jgi:hypothetical protein
MPQKPTATPQDGSAPAADPPPARKKQTASGQVSTKRRTATAKPSTAAKPSSVEVLPGKGGPGGHVSTKPRAAKPKPSTVEVLPVLFSKPELRPMINKARKYARDFEQAGKLLAVALHRLQEAEAHLTYGRRSFGEWAEIEFADIALTKDNANKLSQQGRLILLLESKGRVDLANPRTLPGATGVRALTSVLAKHGEDAMLQVFDAVPADSVVANTVKAAAGALLPPAPAKAAGRAGHQSPLHVDDDPEEPEEVPLKVQNLRDHVERLRSYLDELACADDADPVTIAREYQHFVEDARDLKPVLDAVLPVEGEASIDLEVGR